MIESCATDRLRKSNNIFNLFGYCLLASEEFSAYINEYIGLCRGISFSVIESKSNYICYKKRVVIKGQYCHGFGGMQYTSVCNPFIQCKMI
jgi:hypothetical protein